MQDIESYRQLLSETVAMILTLLGQVGQPDVPPGVSEVLRHDLHAAHDDYKFYSDRLDSSIYRATVVSWMI